MRIEVRFFDHDGKVIAKNQSEVSKGAADYKFWAAVNDADDWLREEMETFLDNREND